MVNKIENPELKAEIKAELDKQKSNLTSNQLPIFEEALNKAVLEGASLKDALKIPQSIIDGYYETGYLYFNSGKFDKALPIFQYLHTLDSTDTRYLLAIAVTLHQMKKYEEAAGTYILYEILDPTNPMPYYHLYDCFSNMNQPVLAVNALKSASRVAGDNPKYTQLKNKIDVEIAILQPS